MTHGPRSVIFGCSGLRLTDAERDFFSRIQPLGFILFLRNCQSPDQVKALTSELRSCVKHDYAPILIDQEGGKVARLTPPHWRVYPEASVFGQMAEDDINKACWAAEVNAFLIGSELYRLGINVDCAPVLDLSVNYAHQIIGSRAFHTLPEICSVLGYHAVKGFQRAGIVPVIKHIPGHGRALVDSHEDLPIVTESLEELQESDFQVFQTVCNQLKEEALPTPWAMTAHVIYDALDSIAPATLSETVIERAIRRYIGFSGFLVSDCITMKALQGETPKMEDRAHKAISAGCDAVLHCSGKLDEMISVATATPFLSPKSLDRFKTGMVSRRVHHEENEDNLWIELNYHLKPYWTQNQRVM